MQKEQTPLPVGTIIRRRYLVEDQLGKSSSGAVYLVRDQRDRQNLFALKEVILPKGKVQTRLTFQSVMLKRLDHPALPRVYDVFNDEIKDRAYILMNYIKGPNLETLQQQQPGKRFSLPQIMTMMAPIMDAVAYLHRQHPPITHGDIKPVNIILPNGDGEAILVDLGIAGLRDANTPIADIHSSTSSYGAPEQYSGGIGPRTDIYALGATLYTLLTGTVPADASYRVTQLNEKNPDPLVLVNQITPSVPIAVAKVIHHAMSIASNNRLSTVRQFWQTLNAFSKVRQSPLLQVSAQDHKVLNIHPVLQRGPAPINPSVNHQPPVTPKQAVARPAAAIVAKQPDAPPVLLPKSTTSAAKTSGEVPIQLDAPPLLQQTSTAVAAAPASPHPIITPKQVDVRPSAAAQQPRAPHSRKHGMLLPILLALLISLSLGTFLSFYAVSTHRPVTTSPTAEQHKSISPIRSKPTVAPTFSVNIVGTYQGTIYNIAANVTSKMSLTITQQSQKNISGNFTGLQVSGALRGIIDTSRHLQFRVTNSAGQITLSFDGAVQADGNLAGTYCGLNQNGQCAGEYGIWSAAPGA